MTSEQVGKLVEYGKSIDILVTPVEIDGQAGVHYTDVATKDASRAHRDLLALSLQIECAAL